MAQALPLDVYHLLEDRLGREQADKVASAIEIGFDLIEKKADAVALQKKLELREELTHELATKADLRLTEAKLEGKMETLKTDLERKMEMFKIDLEGKMETMNVGFGARIDGLNQKLNFMIILMLLALTLMNPVMADLIKGALR